MEISLKNPQFPEIPETTNIQIRIKEIPDYQVKIKEETSSKTSKEISEEAKFLIGRDSNLIRGLILQNRLDLSDDHDDKEDIDTENITDEDFLNFNFDVVNRINLSLLSKFYLNEEVNDDEILELVNNLDYLDSSRLKEVLYSIRNKKIKYSSLNENLIEIIENVKFVQIACGEHHTSAIRDDGMMVTWGRSKEGQYENIPLTGRFIQIACGFSHTSAIRDDGSVVTWGNNYRGQYDNIPSGKFIQITCGYYHTSAIRDDGSVVTWGEKYRSQYKNIPLSGKFIKIACGSYHTSAIRDDGSVVTWGHNGMGQYDNIPVFSSTPSDDGIDERRKKKFVQIACGFSHTNAIRDDGTVFTWGSNYLGQWSNTPGSEENSHEKRNPSKFTQIVCGGCLSCAVRGDGTVVIWGGEGNLDLESDLPTNVAQIAFGIYQMSGIRNDGTAFDYGSKYSFKGAFEGSFEEKRGGKFFQIACGTYHTSAIRDDGTVITWGNKQYGQHDNLPVRNQMLDH